MNIQVKNLKRFNDIGFVAHSARVSGVGKVACECGANENSAGSQGCEACGGSGLREPTDEEIFDMVLENDYSSALEHIVFTFEISGLSKGNAPELLEHRIASHTGRSTRYHREDGFDFNMPPGLKGILEKAGLSAESFKETLAEYRGLQDLEHKVLGLTKGSQGGIDSDRGGDTVRVRQGHSPVQGALQQPHRAGAAQGVR